jgi:lysyl-tRNA synthetase class 2
MKLQNSMFEKLNAPTLIQPTFVTHLPKELVPIAKLSPDDPTTVEVFECCTGSMMLLGQESIRDVILFPQLKPK